MSGNLLDGWTTDPDQPSWFRDPHRPGYRRDALGAWYDDGPATQGVATTTTEGLEDAGRLTPVDWVTALAEGLPEVRFLKPPYIPEASRVFAWGPAESGKSLFFLHMASELSREGISVIYLSMENPLREDLRRLGRLAPDPAHLILLRPPMFDLADPKHATALGELVTTCGAKLLVVDTLSSCWSGDENDNAAIIDLDRKVLAPMANNLGVSIVLIDHTGHLPVMGKRRSAEAGRGASAKGQKADVILAFEPRKDGFVLKHGKARIGGSKEADLVFTFFDTDDGRIDIATSHHKDVDLVASRTADRMVDVILQHGPIGTRELDESVSGGAGVKVRAREQLARESPARVACADESFPDRRGRRRSMKVWRPAADGQRRSTAPTASVDSQPSPTQFSTAPLASALLTSAEREADEGGEVITGGADAVPVTTADMARSHQERR